MAGFTAQGATFTFQAGGVGLFQATLTGISIETPTAEVADMTAAGEPVNYIVLVPTGAWSGGSMSVDYIRASTASGPNTGPQQIGDPQSLVTKYGVAMFSAPGISVSRNVILQSASTEARVGDLVRGSLRFVLTDYTGP
jgi:hypothetical protein